MDPLRIPTVPPGVTLPRALLRPQVAGEARAAVRPSVGQADLRRTRQAAQDFEALFIHHLLKNMRQASDVGGGGFLQGTGHKIYQDMLDDEVAKAVSRSGGLGLADLLVRDLVRRHHPEKNPSSQPAGRPIEGAVKPDASDGGDR